MSTTLASRITTRSVFFLWKAEKHGRSNQGKEKTKQEQWAKRATDRAEAVSYPHSWYRSRVGTLAVPESTGRNHGKRERYRRPRILALRLWGIYKITSHSMYKQLQASVYCFYVKKIPQTIFNTFTWICIFIIVTPSWSLQSYSHVKRIGGKGMDQTPQVISPLT